VSQFLDLLKRTTFAKQMLYPSVLTDDVENKILEQTSMRRFF